MYRPFVGEAMSRSWTSNNERYTDSLEIDTQPSQDMQATRRIPGACAHCKSLKIRCEYLPEENVCVRCKMGNHECISRGRKKRRPAPTHEDLQERSHSQDLEIQDLLRQLDQMHTKSKIDYWISKAKSEAVALADQSPDIAARKWCFIISFAILISQPADASTAMWPGESSGLGAIHASQALTGFAASSCNDRRQRHLQFIPAGVVDVSQDMKAPNILRCGLLHPFEIRSLFDIFFEKVNPCLPLLDQELHTPERLVVTSPFLFTVVCALASRHDIQRSKLRRLVMELAMDTATEALREGLKTVETCQAYLLLSIHPIPNKKWTDDRRLLLMTISIRLAQELKLDQTPPSSCGERLSLNYTRTWLSIDCVDKSYAIQFGRPPTIQQRDDYVPGITRTWYNSTLHNTRYDIYLCGYSELHSLTAQFWKAIRHDRAEARENLNEMSVAMGYDKKMADLASDWDERLHQDSNASDQCWILHIETFKLVGSYLRLATLSAGFQTAVKQGLQLNPHILSTSVQLARSILRSSIERLYPAGPFPFIFEAHFLYIAFAAAFLVNLSESRFLSLLHPQQQPNIVEDVERLIEILGSNDGTLDSRHTPGIFSRFLASLLRRQAISSPYDPISIRSPIGEAQWFPDSRRSGDSMGRAGTTTQGETYTEFSFGQFMATPSPPSSSSSSPVRLDTNTPGSSHGWSANFRIAPVAPFSFDITSAWHQL